MDHKAWNEQYKNLTDIFNKKILFIFAKILLTWGNEIHYSVLSK